MFSSATQRVCQTLALLVVAGQPPELYAQQVEFDDPFDHVVVVRRKDFVVKTDGPEFLETMFQRSGLGRASILETENGLKRDLRGRIYMLNLRLPLSRENRRKLELAGRADIKRFLDLVEQQKQTLLENADVEAVRWVKHVRQSVTILSDHRATLFGDDSLFAKTLAHMAPLPNASTAPRYSSYRYQQAVELVTKFLSHELNLSGDQCARLTLLILSETQPLSRYGELESYAVLHRISKIPPGSLKPILDDTQRRRLAGLCEIANAQEHRLIAEQYLTPTDVAEHANVRESLRLLNQQDFRTIKVK